jgi:hypothetical protein
MIGRTLVATALLAGVAAAAQAQSWRTLELARQLHDSAALTVRVPYSSGKIGVKATTGPWLYRSSVGYDATRQRPVYSFDSSARTMRIGTEGGTYHVGSDDRRNGELRLELAHAVPLDLALDLAAVQGDLDLSSLRLSRLRIESAASDVKVRFDTLNPVAMSSLELDVNAAALQADQLANANAREVRVHTNVGGADLDFGGHWTQDIDLRVDLLLGDVTVHVPSDVGVRVELDRFVASFQHDGLVKRSDAFYSENWDSAPRKLRIRAETNLGKLKLVRG